MRLRQIVLAASDLDRVEADFAAVFGWQVAYRDPVVEKWGLRNIVIPVANAFIEVVSPLREGTSAGRHLARIGGDGGYMVMFQVSDRAKETARLERAGVRAVYRSDQETYCLTQFHPADCGGLMLSWEQVLHPDGADWRVPDGYWHAAHGLDWRRHVVTTRVGSIKRVVLGGPSGEALAQLYARLLAHPVKDDRGVPVIHLPGPDLAFETREGPGGIVRIEIEAVDRAVALRAAGEHGLSGENADVTICGIGIRLV